MSWCFCSLKEPQAESVTNWYGHKFATGLFPWKRKGGKDSTNQSGFSTGYRLSMDSVQIVSRPVSTEDMDNSRKKTCRIESEIDKLTAYKSTNYVNLSRTYLLMSHGNLNCKIHDQQHWALAWIVCLKSPRPTATSSLRGLGLRRSKI